MKNDIKKDVTILTKKRIDNVNKDKANRDTIRLRDTTILGLEGQVSALENENGELEKIIKDLRNRFINGGIAYVDNKDGYIVNAVRIPSYSEYTFDQDIPEEIGTKLYNSFPYIKQVDRIFIEDAEQLKKYKGAKQ